MNRTWNHSAALAALSVLLATGAAAQEVKEIGRTTEKELKVVLTSSFGSLRIARGESGKMVVLKNERGEPGFNVDYAVRNRIGYMDLSLGENESADEGRKHSGFHFSGLKGGDWSLEFSDAVPISFDIQMGVGRGDLNLSGLTVKDLNVSTGASDVCLAFDQPNATTVENINIEAGVSKFEGRQLGNANFRHFRFQGGVGTCKLDFGGELEHEVDVDVQVGMGVMTILVPQNVGARVFYEKNWISRVDCAKDFTSVGESEYMSENYNSAQGKMNIRVDSGVGSVKILRP
ncbi:MAG TPA: hypothetical protein VF889_09850 [Bacteroidota bacterium]